MNTLKKILLLVLIGAVVFGLAGCKKKSEHPTNGEHPSVETPTAEHPTAEDINDEHPKAEHPKAEHPKGEHPK